MACLFGVLGCVSRRALSVCFASVQCARAERTCHVQSARVMCVARTLKRALHRVQCGVQSVCAQRVKSVCSPCASCEEGCVYRVCALRVHGVCTACAACAARVRCVCNVCVLRVRRTVPAAASPLHSVSVRRGPGSATPRPPPVPPVKSQRHVTTMNPRALNV